MSEKQLQIRNSTAEFLIFQAEDKAQGVQVFYENETITPDKYSIDDHLIEVGITRVKV